MGDFAEKCRKQGGYFKCCIRRDTAACHECRFCCSLLVCTFKDGNGEPTNRYEKEFETGSKDIRALSRTLGSGLGDPFYGCYKPEEKRVDPASWGLFDLDSFYDTTDKVENYKEGKAEKFDKNYMNFEDPEVLREMTEPENEEGEVTKTWQKTFNVDFAAVGADSGKCVLNCEEARKGKFAEDCHKNNGIFKCCMRIWELYEFALVRQKLEEANLLQMKEDKEVCGMDKGKEKNHCTVCTNLYICSKKGSVFWSNNHRILNEFKSSKADARANVEQRSL